MSRSFAVIAVMAVCSPQAWAETYYSYAAGKRFAVTVTEEAVAKAPAWADDADDPPLSARKAREAADAVRVRLVPDGLGGKWTLTRLSLVPTAGGWVWKVGYRSPADGSDLRGELVLTVLMNGTVVEPEVTPSKY